MGDNSKIYAFDKNGNLIEGWPKSIEGSFMYSSPFLGDIDNDNEVDLIVAGYSLNYDKKVKKLYVWNLNNPYNPETMEWPMFQHDSQHTGFYGYEEIVIRPQSKIVNGLGEDLNGNLIMILQKKVGEIWENVEIVVEQEITIPANELLKLDIGKDSLGNLVFAGWNNLDVSVSSVGQYRVYAKFENDFIRGTNWEFEVV